MMVQEPAPELLGPYRLVRRLGEGGMGVVYLASDESGGLVAVKALRPGLAADPTARRRLDREVAAMRRVQSPNVAEVLDADLDSDVPFIVTRYVPGQTLDAIVGQEGPLAGDALARLVRGLAAALAAVHAAGVVHRDLKPGNVMIEDGEPVVIDFGIAQMPGATRLTLTGMFMGTPGFLAPEVIEGTVSGPPADVHSWGATIAFAATGRPPFGTGSFESIFFRIMHGQPDLDTLPEPLWPVIEGALARNPADRPSAAGLCQLVGALDPRALVASPAGSKPEATRTSPAGAAAGAPGAASVNGGERAQRAGWAAGAALPAAAGGSAPTMADPAAGGYRANSTQPLASGLDADIRDLLPPVWWPPAEAADPRLGAVAPGGPGAAGQYAGPPAAAGPGGQQAWAAAGPALAGAAAPGGRPAPGARTRSPVSAWSPLVVAAMAVAAAVAVIFPVAGTPLALAVILALHASERTSRRLDARRARSGRPAGALRAAGYFPVALLRSVLHLLLVAPAAILGFGIAAAAAIIVLPVHPLPTAVALGSGALVAVLGLGPGSSGARKALARLFGRAAVRPGGTAAAYAAMAAVAAGSAITAFSQAAVYWPVTNVHSLVLRLPAVHAVLHDTLVSLARLVHRTGL